MANPLYSQLGGGTPRGNMMNLITQFNKFRSQFRGDPKQQVQELLNSGQMTQEQFNQLQEMASQFQKLLT